MTSTPFLLFTPSHKKNLPPSLLTSNDEDSVIAGGDLREIRGKKEKNTQELRLERGNRGNHNNISRNMMTGCNIIVIPIIRQYCIS